MDTLINRFEKASLALELHEAPLFADRAAQTQDIVQIDIARAERRHRATERFRIFPGNETNRLEVLGTDRKLRQLVLFVDEPDRAFTIRLPKTVEEAQRTPIVRRDGKFIWVERRTGGRARHFLCGMDEQHLFIALVPERVSTVRAAHESLRDPLVDAIERRAPRATIRQGEWFFVALPETDEEEIDRLARKSLRTSRGVGIAQAAGIRRAGRQHVADEVLVLRGIPDASGNMGLRIFVRGSVRHPDHRTVDLKTWRRTVINRESIEQVIEGVNWVD
jgi:hypothetical protein